MFKRYLGVQVNLQLNSNIFFSNLEKSISLNRSFHCPYDGITFCIDRPPSPTFLNLVSSAEYDDYNVIGKRRVYKHLLKHRLFIVQWDPLPLFNKAPYTSIKINPNVQQITPSQLLALIEFIGGNYHDAQVMRFDEKVDIDQYSTTDVAKRIYVAHKRTFNDFLKKNQTYYIGTSKGEQVKVYNKAKQLRMKNLRLVRIERTVKYSKVDRPLVTTFLFKSRDDAFDNVTIANINKLHHRSKLRRLIDQEGMLMKAYILLSKTEKKAFKRHAAFLKPCFDLKQAFLKDLVEWINTSPNLVLKIWLDEMMRSLMRKQSIGASSRFTNQYHMELVPAYACIPNEPHKPRILTGGSNLQGIFYGTLLDANRIVELC